MRTQTHPGCRCFDRLFFPGRRVWLLLGIFGFCLFACAAEGLSQKPRPWPSVESVDAQPLVAQVKRLREALTFLGSPLSPKTTEALEAVHAAQPARQVTKAVQQLLDPYCLAGVAIEKGGKVRVVTGKRKPELLQEGWRNFLVKVVNRGEFEAQLSVSSPNSGDKPGAPANEVNDRWMEVNMFDGRPLMPRLSGLALEYRIVQIYSSKGGTNKGTLEFRVIGTPQPAGNDPSLIKEWAFDKNLGGWQGTQKATLNQGAVTITSKTGPSFLQRIAPEPAVTGKLVLRFWMKSPVNARGAVLWANGPVSQGNIGQASYSVKRGPAREYRVVLDVKNLSGMRIGMPSGSTVDWIRLSKFSKQRLSPTAITTDFRTLPAATVTLRVVDEKLQPTTAAFHVTDQKGRVYPTQSKRLAPDFFFHPQVYRSNGEKLALPPGEYTIRCWRGPESVPVTSKLKVGSKPTTFDYVVRRWVDPAARGWYSGDHHIHAAGCAHYQNPTQGVHANDMARHCMGEDLKVGCNLTWGPCFDYQKQFFTGRVAAASKYPYLLRYDVEVSGFGSHVSGHLCLLRLKEQIYPGGDSKNHWPTLGLNTLKWAKAQGAICGPAHSSAGLQVSTQRIDAKDGPPLPGWKGFGGPGRKAVTNLPNYFIPRYNGIGANEYIVDVTHRVPGPGGKLVRAVDFISSMNTDRVAEWNMWYHTLNCGFRVRTSGETDFPCVTGDRVGIGRVYVKVKGRLTYDDWCQGISEGRSYVSDGSAHLMDLSATGGGQTIALGERGSELRLERGGQVRLKLKAAVRRPGQKTIEVQLIHNGFPVAAKSIPADGSTRDVGFQTKVSKSGWLAVRVGASAHTNPIFVVVAGKPIRASVASAEWCLKGVEQCWKSKQPTYAKAEQDDAKAAYDHARKTYRRILEEARTAN